jgi:lipopolysaccharide/colanic/teichoic acid biosynthesis glycosyltransferase
MQWSCGISVGRLCRRTGNQEQCSQIVYKCGNIRPAPTGIRSSEGTAVASIPVLAENALPEHWTWRVIGAFERIVAGFLLIVTAPVLLFFATAIFVLSRSTPLIAHRRVGRCGAELWMLKLRTMWGPVRSGSGGWIERIEDERGPARKGLSDARVTSAFARFCRRHSIDELPQLWHVVLGDMALIGPRPLTARELREHYGSAAEETLRVRPGIAGLWQTSGRNRLTYAERRRMDLEFVRGRSVGMYLRIAARTLPEIWSGANSW